MKLFGQEIKKKKKELASYSSYLLNSVKLLEIKKKCDANKVCWHQLEIYN